MSWADRDHRRDALKQIAESTIKALSLGRYRVDNVIYHLHTRASQEGTRYYPPVSELTHWSTVSITQLSRNFRKQTYISILEISTLDCIGLLASTLQNNPSDIGRIGVLNFASATKPGGGFRNGAEAQEETIARSSTLYPTLLTSEAQQFYRLHKRDARNPFYTHAMIYSPEVEIIRNDDGAWTVPLPIDVVTSAAVNAGEVRALMSFKHGMQRTEEIIEAEMKERMARILFLFEKQGARNLVLGSFGTGVFRNHIALIAHLWADLLSSRFRNSFDRVMFAIIGRTTFLDFESAYNAYTQRLRQPQRRKSFGHVDRNGL
jgi:uncharacterized protein (TIGR02452 family)